MKEKEQEEEEEEEETGEMKEEKDDFLSLPVLKGDKREGEGRLGKMNLEFPVKKKMIMEKGRWMRKGTR